MTKSIENMNALELRQEIYKLYTKLCVLEQMIGRVINILQQTPSSVESEMEQVRRRA